MRNQRGASRRGVTLPEILAVLAIISILLLIAVPNFNAMMKAYRISTAVEELTSVLQRARQLAVTRREVHRLAIQASPANTWTLTNIATGSVVDTGAMPPEVNLTVAPAAAYSFNANGACTTPTTYTGSTPTAQYVRIEGRIQGSRVDRYTIEVSPVGRVKTTREHLS